MSEHIIPGRAYTPEQKRDIIEKLLKIWLDAPTLRLGQLMYIVGGSSFDSPTFFYMEDEALITELEKHIIPPQWIPTSTSDPCPQCEQAKSELDLAGALQAMDDFEESMLKIQTSAGTAAANITPISEGILKLAESEEQA